MNGKLVVLAVFALSVGLIGNAYAHKSEVIGDYNVEVGWKKEPAVVGKANSIEVMVTTASASGKVATSMEDHAGMDNMFDSNTTKSDTKKPTTKSNNNKKSTMVSHMGTLSHDHGTKTTGIAGLKLDADITINGKKTMLKLVEDKKTKGKYFATFTPPREGFLTVHIVGKIKNTPIEVSLHPEKVEKPTKK